MLHRSTKSIRAPSLTHLENRYTGLRKSSQSARAAMLPREVGDRVVRGMKSDAPYIFTHAEFAPHLAQRHEAIMREVAAAATFSVVE